MITLVCDRVGSLVRVSVWRGKVMEALYLDDLNRPDQIGARIFGKVGRILAAQKIAFATGDLGEKISFKPSPTGHVGQRVLLEISCSPRQGKPYEAMLVSGDEVRAPLRAWSWALLDYKEWGSLLFSEQEDADHCADCLKEERPELLSKLSVSPKDIALFDVDSVFQTLVTPIVPLSQGASLVIEQTQALVSIDINAGETRDFTAVNRKAIPEIGRQVVMRNLSGIIIVDCLKGMGRTEMNAFLQTFKKAFETDPLKAQVVGVTKLGLIEITRRRRGLSLAEKMERKVS